MVYIKEAHALDSAAPSSFQAIEGPISSDVASAAAPGTHGESSGAAIFRFVMRPSRGLASA